MTARPQLLVALAALVLVSTTVTRDAHADEPTGSEDAVSRAGSLFSEAAALAQQNRWADALELFERSASLRPHARTSYNMGYCERGLGHDTRARMYFVEAMRRDDDGGQTLLSPAQRSAALTYLKQAEERLARPQVELTPAAARIAVDGRPLEVERVDDAGARLVAGTRALGGGEPPPVATFELLIDAGIHEVELSAADGHSVTSSESFEPGSQRVLRLVLPPAPLEPRSPSTDLAPTPTPDGTGQLIGAAVLGCLGAVAALGSIVFAIDAANTYSKAEAACPRLAACPTDEGFELSHEARRSGNIATAGLVVAGAAAAGAVVLWLTAPSGDAAEPEVGLRLGPGRLSLGATF